jgi:hypothetical protein
VDDLTKRLVWLLIFLIQAPLCWSADRTLNNEITHFEELQRAVGSKCINNPEASSVRIDVSGKAHNCAQLISVVNRLGKRIDDQVAALEAKCEAETQRASEVNDVAVQSLQIAQRAGQCKPKSTDVSCLESVGCMIKSVANPLASILESRFNVEKRSCFANGLNSAANCFTEIARGIVTSLVTTMKGIWDLGKLAAVKTAQLFGFLQESERASSDKLLAAQQASPSFIAQFRADSSKALSTLASNIYNGLKNAAMNTFGCEKWDGVPLDPRSKCIRPMTNWNCASCDQKIQVFCGIGGLAAGEIVTGFFTGGLASGAAHIGRGVAASVKLASKSRTMSAAGARGYNSAKAIIAAIPKSAEGIQGATRLAIRAASASRVVMTKTEAAALRSWSAVQRSPINKSFQAFSQTRSGKAILFPANATTMYLRAIEGSVKAGSRTVDTLVARTTAGTRAITVAAKPVELRTFVAENASDKLTTPLENAAWIEVAQAGKKPGQFFVDSQNRLLKQINDKVKDKALADALTNKSSRMMADTLEAFKAKHPGITVDLYSDYKGMRAVVRGPPANQQQLMSELAGDLQRTEAEFSKLIKDNKLLPDELADAHIVSTGVRESYDESNIMSRFGSNVTWDEIGEIWKRTEAGRESLAAKFGDTRLMKTAPGTTKKVFKAEMIEVIRKKSDDVEAAAILSRRYNMTISPTDVTLIRENLAQVNNFAPGLMLADRVQHRFDRAQHGGLTIDFAGVGSYNLEATQIGLAQGDNIADAIVKVRTNEGLVTSDLDRIKRETSRQVQDILRKNGISSQMTVSGDDFVAIPNKPIPEVVKEEIIVATSRGDSVKRASFFPSGMPNARSRAILAVEGEGIEKILRSRLEKYLSQQELSSLIITTDMRGTKPGFGPVGLIMNVPKGMSQTKIRTINQQFGMAVKDMSSNLRKQGRESQFTVAP